MGWEHRAPRRLHSAMRLADKWPPTWMEQAFFGESVDVSVFSDGCFRSHAGHQWRCPQQQVIARKFPSGLNPESVPRNVVLGFVGRFLMSSGQRHRLL